MNLNKYTQKSMEAVQSANSLAIDYGNQTIGQEHLLYALLNQQDGLIGEMMKKMNVSVQNIVSDTEILNFSPGRISTILPVTLILSSLIRITSKWNLIEY